MSRAARPWIEWAMRWTAALALVSVSPASGRAQARAPNPPVYASAAYRGTAHLRHFETVAQRHPRSLVDQFEAGVAAYQNGLPRQAIRYYQACLRIDPGFGQGDDEIGNVYHNELHDTAMALRYYRAATRISPSDAAAWINIGLIDQGMKRWAAALAAYRAATVHAPGDDDGWVRLVFFTVTIHRPRWALAYARDALRALPRNDPARPYLRSVLARKGR